MVVVSELMVHGNDGLKRTQNATSQIYYNLMMAPEAQLNPEDGYLF